MRTATDKEPINSAAHESLSKGTRAALVVGLHVVLIYALVTGLGIVKPLELLKPMEAVMVDASRATQPVKPVMKPQMSQPSLEVTIPEPPPQIDVPVETAPPAAATPAGDAAGSNAVADANLQVTRRVEPVYPPASRRANEQGTGVFNVLVDSSGHPKEVSVRTSTGFARLDQAAMEAIRRWTFSPAIRGSAKVDAWTAVKVTFNLKAT